MAWISVYDGVKDHPKTRKLSNLLECKRHEAIGILVCLWLWGLENADRDGRILNATAEDISDGIMYRGQSVGQSAKDAADCLLKSLVEAGWIDIAETEHDYILHDWDIWQEQWYKAVDRREKETLRKREQRKKEGQVAGQSVGQSAGTAQHNRNRNLTVTVTKDIGGNIPPLTPQDDESAPTHSNKQADRFDAFWSAYPRRVGKEAARKSWTKIKPSEELFQKILAAIAVAKQSEQWCRENGRFIPNPATWLNQGRWDDELPAEEAAQQKTNNPFLRRLQEEGKI